MAVEEPALVKYEEYVVEHEISATQAKNVALAIDPTQSEKFYNYSLAAAVDKQTSIHGPLSQVRVASNTTPPMHPADTDIGQTQRESAERDVLQKVEAIEIDENYELDKIDSRYGSFSSDINVDHKSQEFFFKIGSNQNVEHNLPTVEEERICSDLTLECVNQRHTHMDDFCEELIINANCGSLSDDDLFNFTSEEKL
ncbi:hypothetical protein QE152_g10326 [Popillia japonica]|uniref:Uncharacterized protein n=1 Tax=Popillia japonica TaxID=7064 RepID=A0AAW1LV19_POPJA